MVKTHRALLSRLGPPPVPAVLLDTPFGFQSNADDITARAVAYFRESVGADMGVASLRSAAGTDPLEEETMLARLRAARYAFAGPGSPTYALRQWAASAVPKLLEDKLRAGGCVTFASAAALTLGVATVPVYEIYKVGADPHWLEGLDILAEAGLSAAVIPHYDNAEGGNHDTRYCYLGERRLAAMEADLPADAFVLGVDEHTGLVLDLDTGTAAVVGRGSVTVRKAGRSTALPSGTTLAITELADMARLPVQHRSEPGAEAPPSAPQQAPAPTAGPAPPAASPLLESIARLQTAFDAAVSAGDVAAAVRATLELDDELRAWAGDTLQSDEADRGRAALRGMVVRLGELAEAGARDIRPVVAPFVEILLDARTAARQERRWQEADRLRDRLVALGVEISDAPEGTSWQLRGRLLT
jgi:hypothetical protein